MSCESAENDTKGEMSLKEITSKELERLGTGGAWVWTLFFLCVTPNILNGFHVSSYVFIGHIPSEVYCGVEALEEAHWTKEQIINISSNGLAPDGCMIWNWNYTELSQLKYDEALALTSNMSKPSEVSCRYTQGSSYRYNEEEEGTTIVQEWDLVCEKAVQRTSAQVLVSLGKFFGATTFGIISDKYGRRTAFTIASVVFIIGSLLTASSPWFELFLLGRMGLGAAASGLFYPAFSLLTENIGVQHRSWMSIAFSASYPIGMLFLSLAAYLVAPWRLLQVTLSVPGLLLVLNCFLMIESPRWLLTRNRDTEAYEIVFKKKKDMCITEAAKDDKIGEEEYVPFSQKLKTSIKEFRKLYGDSRMRRLVFTCYFNWCITSMCYYITALNADNLAANRYLYVAITGCVDIPSYILSALLLKFMTRRFAAFSLYILAGISLLVVIAIPRDNANWLVFFAMFGRFGISAVYSVITLHTAEMFPTEIRNSALGTSSTMAHVGSIVAPYVVDVLGALEWFIPTTVCGCCVLSAAFLMLTLPETGKSSLSNHVNEVLEKKEEEK